MTKPVTLSKQFIAQDPWTPLKQYTNARIALSRTGVAIPLAENLHFRADHARARDAVYAPLDGGLLERDIKIVAPQLQLLHVNSLAFNRQVYLQRPDWGRRLNPTSIDLLKGATGQYSYDIAIIVADGLSATAVQLHAPEVLKELLYLLNENNFTVAPVCVATQARVAISDEIGSLLNSRLSLILIGERPGLSSPHSMGIYITYRPAVGNTDESRNCISNIHPQGGLNYKEAAAQAYNLIKNALSLQLSGVHLKSHKRLDS
jgi:ethanolamine ammonia-lyase small subunit